MAANKKVTPKVFACVKTLLNGGAMVKEVSDYMGLSGWTVHKINKSETYEEYRQIIEEETSKRKEKYNTPVEAKKPAIQAPDSVGDKVYGANRICELLTHQNELLKGIMNKLAFIVDELTGVPSPKDGDRT